jgi:hypothetical protein
VGGGTGINVNVSGGEVRELGLDWLDWVCGGGKSNLNKTEADEQCRVTQAGLLSFQSPCVC